MTGFVVPPPMISPWPSCCGKPMWFGPYGYACDCTPRAEPAPVVVVEFPVEAGQFALFTAAQVAA